MVYTSKQKEKLSELLGFFLSIHLIIWAKHLNYKFSFESFKNANYEIRIYQHKEFQR